MKKEEEKPSESSESSEESEDEKQRKNKTSKKIEDKAEQLFDEEEPSFVKQNIKAPVSSRY